MNPTHENRNQTEHPAFTAAVEKLINPPQKDMFGNPVLPKPKGPKKNGYPKPPGSGPVGETCKTCAHIRRVRHAKTYIKCGLLRDLWTRGPGTDIKAGSPACSMWNQKEGK